jgi:hypothetical protein
VAFFSNDFKVGVYGMLQMQHIQPISPCKYTDLKDESQRIFADLSGLDS